MSNIDKFLTDLFVKSQANDEMYCISSIFVELHTALRDPAASLTNIASIIERDPGLSVAILRVANSNYYGLSKRVTTIRMAISILGYKTLERIFLTQAFRKAIKTDESPAVKALWHHSLACAVASQKIISLHNPQLAEQAFVAGLLHDIGKFLLVNFEQDSMNLCLEKVKKNPHQYSVPLEMEIFGTNHQEIGEYFTRKWLFPAAVTRSIKLHHSLELAEEVDEITASVAVANQIVKALELGSSTAGLIEDIPIKVYKAIGFKQDNFEKVARETRDRFYELTKVVDS